MSRRPSPSPSTATRKYTLGRNCGLPNAPAQLPTSVEREITWTEPAVKGDTSGKVLKPAKIATGYEVAVPLFVAQGDKIEIDTRTGEYRKRV